MRLFLNEVCQPMQEYLSTNNFFFPAGGGGAFRNDPEGSENSKQSVTHPTTDRKMAWIAFGIGAGIAGLLCLTGFLIRNACCPPKDLIDEIGLF